VLAPVAAGGQFEKSKNQRLKIKISGIRLTADE